jgi:hypothetical protein
METLNGEDGAVMSDLWEQIERLETRLLGIESHGKTDSAHEVSGFIEVDEASSAAHGADIDYSNNLNFLSKVRKCNFMEFKNR